MSDVVTFTELAEALFARPGWQELSNCIGLDSELFFPERGEATEEAKRICFHCPVKVDCLEYALTHFIKVGVWGGRSERERRRMRKERRQALVKGLALPVVRPIDELPDLVPRRPKSRPAPRFDGDRLVRAWRPKNRDPLPRRRPATRFNGECLVHAEAA
jgi:WhiB family transcriptional regulator, redox-sensing transcriptional regulator